MSVEALQERSISLELTGVALSPVGTDGGVVSGGGEPEESWHVPEPESITGWPPIGTKAQSYEPGCSVSLSTPKVVAMRTSLFAAGATIEVWFAPPVPAMNSRMPAVVSGWPDGVCAAKRS